MKKNNKKKNNNDISTQDLYIVEVVMQVRTQINRGKEVIGTKSYVEPKYILARKKYDGAYTDIFTKTVYKLCNSPGVQNGELVAVPVAPIISNSELITYKDANEILANKNCVIIKNKSM